MPSSFISFTKARVTQPKKWRQKSMSGNPALDLCYVNKVDGANLIHCTGYGARYKTVNVARTACGVRGRRQAFCELFVTPA